MIEYPVGESGQLLVLTDEVVEYFRRHRQVRRRDKEAGGQLFARFENLEIIVEEVTGPRATDRRTRWSYAPDRVAEQTEIVERYARGLHYVGDWHTHPETHARPSPTDTASIGECAAKSAHQLNGFILVVIGRAEPPEGLHVSIHDARQGFAVLTSARRLEPLVPSELQSCLTPPKAPRRAPPAGHSP